MSTPTLISTIARLALGAAIVTSATGCGSEMLRTGRAPAYLVVQQLTGEPGGGFDTSNVTLYSDVETVVEGSPTYFPDAVRVTLGAELKNPSIAATAINNITLTRYHVNFIRADGRNTPGVDVPYPIDGALGVVVAPGGTADVLVETVRYAAKLESPLRQLRRGGSQMFISAIAEITIYGRDQNANEVMVTAPMNVTFADFGDPK